MMSNLLFLYGSIKTGQPNHALIKDVDSSPCRLVGTGRTETKWPLVIATKYNIPFLLDKEGEGHNVHGEVYEMDDDLLAAIDEKEGCPDAYVRRKVKIVMDNMSDGSDPNTLECWFYVLPRFTSSMLLLERYQSYDSNGAHGKAYIQTYDHATKQWLVPSDEVYKEIAKLGIQGGQT